MSDYWKCLACTERHVFTRENNIRTHIQQTHQKTIPTEPINMLLSDLKYSAPDNLAACPLCKDPEDQSQKDPETLLNHVAEHVHDFSIRALPWPSDSPDSTASHLSIKNAEMWLDVINRDEYLEEHDDPAALETFDSNGHREQPAKRIMDAGFLSETQQITDTRDTFEENYFDADQNEYFEDKTNTERSSAASSDYQRLLKPATDAQSLLSEDSEGNLEAVSPPPLTPRSRRDFQIAIICDLPLVAQMVELAMDVDWTETGYRFGKAQGDSNTYTTGVIAGHNIVLAFTPGMGSIIMVQNVVSLRMSFQNIKLAFLVDLCSAVPIHKGPKREIFLGDCLISTKTLQFHVGKQLEGWCLVQDGLYFSRMSSEIRAMLAALNTRRRQSVLTKKSRNYLEKLLNLSEISLPHPETDRLFDAQYLHTHRPPDPHCLHCNGAPTCNKDCISIGCEGAFIVLRTKAQNALPQIHFGSLGSANVSIRSGVVRDQIARKHGIIGFNMAGSEMSEIFPTLIVAGACDYADGHKNNAWQLYAAASAAAGLKAVLSEFQLEETRSDMESEINASAVYY